MRLVTTIHDWHDDIRISLWVWFETTDKYPLVYYVSNRQVFTDQCLWCDGKTNGNFVQEVGFLSNEINSILVIMFLACLRGF